MGKITKVTVHPADPQKVVVESDDGSSTACDNIDGEWDEFLTPEQIKARQACGHVVLVLRDPTLEQKE